MRLREEFVFVISAASSGITKPALNVTERKRSMDKTDEKILSILKGNARMSHQELGDALGMSRQGQPLSGRSFRLQRRTIFILWRCRIP